MFDAGKQKGEKRKKERKKKNLKWYLVNEQEWGTHNSIHTQQRRRKKKHEKNSSC